MPRVLRITAMAAVAAAALVRAQGTLFVDEPFGAGWTPGALYARGGTYTANVNTNLAQTPATCLRMVDATQNKFATLEYTRAQPTTAGINISFTLAQWGGSGADGMAFYLRSGSSAAGSAYGAAGSSMGYTPERPVGVPGAPSYPGMVGGLLAVALDKFGSISATSA